MEVDLHDFLGIAPNAEFLTARVPGQTLATTVALFLGKDFILLRDPSGVVRAGLRNEDESALVIFAYSQKPATLPVTMVGKQTQLHLAGDNISVILAVDGKQRQLLVTEPLKSTTLVLGVATDHALFHLGTMEVVQVHKS
jgi:hypothetical protein